MMLRCQIKHDATITLILWRPPSARVAVLCDCFCVTVFLRDRVLSDVVYLTLFEWAEVSADAFVDC